MFDKKGVFWFLGLTFGLTWLLDLVIYLLGGEASPGVITALQFQGQIPAFCAILLGLFFFPESPIYFKRPASRGRWFYYFFLLYTVIFALILLKNWQAPVPEETALLLSMAPQILSFLGLLILIILRITAGRQAMARVWLAWGKGRYWLLFGLAFVAYYVLQVVLNAVFGLGPVKPAPITIPPGLSPETFLIVNVVQTLVGSLLAVVLAFGEEYGWRGYLQSELFKLGRIRGVLLLGLIWGVWHWPIILMGHNYPDHPTLGLPLMVLYSTGIGVVLGYAVLKTGSVLLAAFLHGLNNLIANIIVSLGFAPFDSALSFFTGIFGIASIAVLVILILRDPIWRGRGSDPAQLSLAPVDRALSDIPGTEENTADLAELGITSNR